MTSKNIYLWLKRSFEKDGELLLKTLIAFCVKILGALLSILLTYVAAKALGVNQSGYFFLGITVVTIISTFSRVGLDKSIVRFSGAAYAENDGSTIKTIFKLSIMYSGIISVFISFLVFFGASFIADFVFHKPEMTHVLRNASPAILGLSLSTILASNLQAIRSVVSSVFTLNIGIPFLLILAIIFFSAETASLVCFLYSLSIWVIVGLGFFLFVNRSHSLGGDVLRHSTEIHRELFASAIPLWVVAMMAQFVLWSGQLFSGVWLSAEEVANVTVAQRISMTTSFILISVNFVVAPHFAALYKQGRYDELNRVATNSVRWMILISLPFVVFMIIFPDFLMGLFGEDFVGRGLLLQVFVLGQFVNLATGSVGILLTMTGHERDFRNSVLCSGPIAVLLSVTLIPWLGMLGSALSTAIAVATQNLLAVWWVRKRLGFNTLAVWRKHRVAELK